MSTVAIIIPFYQRSRGVLSRALDSVAAQTFKDVQVIVVDDASPLPADDEINARPQAERDRITLIGRPNGGPGAARNTGLDAVPPAAHHIAFLDSDDRWEPHHLETAVEALDAGYDFFFADYTWRNASSTRFMDTGLDKRTAPIAPGSSTMSYGPEFYEAVLSFWPVHLSTTVIDAGSLGRIRFDERLKYSSEDMHYFLQCANATAKVCYSTRLGVRFEDGMKFYSRQTVGSYEFSRARLSNAYFHRLIAEETAAHGGKVRALNRRLLKANYFDFIRSEAKALVCHGRLHIALYGDFVRVVQGSNKPPKFASA
jgi:succinoglycan biosynthesis protein ExoW